MSVNAVARTIKEDIALLAFLPVANTGYLLIEENSRTFLSLLILSIFFSSMLYNYLRADTGDVESTQRIVLLIVGAIWMSLFLSSIYYLYVSFSKESYIPEVLFSTSVLFFFLLITDRIWDYLLDSYEGIL